MAELTYAVIPTNIGLAKIQAAIFDQEDLVLTEVAYGDGDGAYYYPTPDQTALKNEISRIPIIAKEVDEALLITWFSCLITASMPSGVIREVGLYDKDGDLCFIGNVPDIYKVTTEEGVVIDIPLELGIKNSYAEHITIPPGGDYITREWLYAHYAVVDLSNINEAGIAAIREYGAGPIFYTDYTVNTTVTGKPVVLQDREGNNIIPVRGYQVVDKIDLIENIVINEQITSAIVEWDKIPTKAPETEAILNTITRELDEIMGGSNE